MIMSAVCVCVRSDRKGRTTARWNAMATIEIVLALWWLVKPKLATIRDGSWQTPVPDSVWCQHLSVQCVIKASHWSISDFKAIWLAIPRFIGLSINVCPSQLSINPRCFDASGKGFLTKFQSPPVSPLVKTAPSLPSTPTSPTSPASPGWSSPSPGPRTSKIQGSPFAKFRQLEDNAAQGPGSGSRYRFNIYVVLERTKTELWGKK